MWPRNATGLRPNIGSPLARPGRMGYRSAMHKGPRPLGQPATTAPPCGVCGSVRTWRPHKGRAAQATCDPCRKPEAKGLTPCHHGNKRSTCRPCLNSRVRRWRIENPEKYLQGKRREEAKRRARKHDALCITCGGSDYATLPQGNLCFYCGVSPADTTDHVVPLSRGGAHCNVNFVPACGPCNSKKWANATP